jgi:hypothetical protein
MKAASGTRTRSNGDLAHGDSNAVRGVYHRGKHWEERVRMAQWWSDYLDTIRDGGKVINVAFAKGREGNKSNDC